MSALPNNLETSGLSEGAGQNALFSSATPAGVDGSEPVAERKLARRAVACLSAERKPCAKRKARARRPPLQRSSRPHAFVDAELTQL